jgi:dihydroorotase-like cyclic amidohydrolase
MRHDGFLFLEYSGADASDRQRIRLTVSNHDALRQASRQELSTANEAPAGFPGIHLVVSAAFHAGSRNGYQESVFAADYMVAKLSGKDSKTCQSAVYLPRFIGIS